MTSLRLEKQGFPPAKAVQCCLAVTRECSRMRGHGHQGEEAEKKGVLSRLLNV